MAKDDVIEFDGVVDILPSTLREPSTVYVMNDIVTETSTIMDAIVAATGLTGPAREAGISYLATRLGYFKGRGLEAIYPSLRDEFMSKVVNPAMERGL